MFLFCVFLVVWQDMTKEVGEIISEMEENMSSPMRTIYGFVDQISIKWLARGILRRWIDYLRLPKKDLENFVFGEEFGRSMWRFWKVMKEKLWEWGL
jgi:hypothetical protein